MLNLTVRHEELAGHFEKYFIEGLPFQVAFHHFLGPDTGPPHDHPWPFVSTVKAGGYTEEVFDPVTGRMERYTHMAGDSFHVPSWHVHRITELHGDTWTCVTWGENERVPGFYEFREDGAYHRFYYEAEFKRMGGPL